MLHFVPSHWIASRIPWLFGAPALHRAGLSALHRGAYPLADTLFERAAERYREDLAVEPLARLRIHQLIARMRSGLHPEQDSEAALEIEHRLARLREIESLEPPFELMTARALQGTWSHLTGGTATESHSHAERRAA